MGTSTRPVPSTQVDVLCVGGTIDKIYHDALSDYQVGEPQVAQILDRAGLAGQYRLQSLLRKDSLDMTAEDRAAVRTSAAASESSRILITHGTDTMLETARALDGIEAKTIVLVGAMQPARMRESDADFNIGFAWAALQCLPPGIYVAMSGRILDPAVARKNRAAGRFEDTASD